MILGEKKANEDMFNNEQAAAQQECVSIYALSGGCKLKRTFFHKTVAISIRSFLALLISFYFKRW